jgi:hypothetical protein
VYLFPYLNLCFLVSSIGYKLCEKNIHMLDYTYHVLLVNVESSESSTSFSLKQQPAFFHHIPPCCIVIILSFIKEAQRFFFSIMWVYYSHLILLQDGGVLY